MADVKSLVKGVIAFFFALIFTFVSAYVVPTLIDVVITDTVIKGVLWVGYIMLIVVALVVWPAMVITGSSQ